MRDVSPKHLIRISWLLALSLPLHLSAGESKPLVNGAEPNQSSSVTPSLVQVNPEDRASSAAFYKAVYLPADAVPIGWTGNIAECTAGTTSSAFSEATILRVNYFRLMTGLAPVELDASLHDKCQKAALMMSAQGALSHHPDPNWACYSPEGAEAAANSNIYRGRDGASAVSGYMDDFGANNYFVGHRRWILYPPQSSMGTGSVPTFSGYIAANALWVVNRAGSRPPGPAWVAWPPKGFVPYQVMPRISSRWSFSYQGADFSSAKVTMQRDGVEVPLTVESLANEAGYADNAIVWVPQGIPLTPPETDLTYTVNLADVSIAGALQSFSYAVTVMDPDREPVEPAQPAFTAIFVQDNGTVVVEWNGTGKLESTSTADGAWTEVPNAESPHFVTDGGKTGFFRLR